MNDLSHEGTDAAGSRSTSSDKTWALVGKIAALATILALVLGIATWLSTERAKIKVQAQALAIAYPPPLNRGIDRIRDAMQWGLRLPSADSTEKQDPFSWRTRRSLEEDTLIAQLGRWTAFDYYWSMTIRNKGNAQTSVNIRVPEVRLAQIRQEGQPDRLVRIQDGQDVVQIGEVRPNETVSLLAWVDSYSMARPGAEDLKLLLSSGKSDISYIWPIGGFWQWVALSFVNQLKFGFGFGAFILSLAVLVHFLSSLMGSKPATNEPATPTSDEQP